VNNADFGSKQPTGSSYGASASRDYILGTFTRYFRWCFAGSNNRTVREREAAREAIVDQGNFVQGEVKAQPVARVLTSGLENTRLSLIRLITAISDDGTYQNRAMGTGTSKRCRRSASRVRGAWYSASMTVKRDTSWRASREIIARLARVEHRRAPARLDANAIVRRSAVAPRRPHRGDAVARRDDAAL
jgi:hypothetical protein